MTDHALGGVLPVASDRGPARANRSDICLFSGSSDRVRDLRQHLKLLAVLRGVDLDGGLQARIVAFLAHGPRCFRLPRFLAPASALSPDGANVLWPAFQEAAEFQLPQLCRYYCDMAVADIGDMALLRETLATHAAAAAVAAQQMEEAYANFRLPLPPPQSHVNFAFQAATNFDDV